MSNDKTTSTTKSSDSQESTSSLNVAEQIDEHEGPKVELNPLFKLRVEIARDIAMVMVDRLIRDNYPSSRVHPLAMDRYKTVASDSVFLADAILTQIAMAPIPEALQFPVSVTE